MGGGRLGIAPVGLHLGGVDQVGELDGVLDEEDRDVVAHQVPVAFLGVELHREAAHVPRGVGRSGAAGDGGDAHEHRGLLPGALEEVGLGDVRQALVELEIAVGGRAAGVDDAFRNPLVVEVEDLLAKDEVLQQHRAFFAGLQLVLIIGHTDALVGGQGVQK